jgi:hypothetical protein
VQGDFDDLAQLVPLALRPERAASMRDVEQVAHQPVEQIDPLLDGGQQVARASCSSRPRRVSGCWPRL